MMGILSPPVPTWTTFFALILERHVLRFPGLGLRQEVPCLCGELRRFTKPEATTIAIYTANLPPVFPHRRSMCLDCWVYSSRTQGGKEQAEQELTI